MKKSQNLLLHFDGDKPLVLSCDASPYGHRLEDGTKRPITFASRTLATVEKNYSHLDKETLAIIFGVKYHVPPVHIYGRLFVILSPLKHMFSKSRATPAMASARLQRCALTTIELSTNQDKDKPTPMRSANCHSPQLQSKSRHHPKLYTSWNT